MNKVFKFLGIGFAIIVSIGLIGCATSANLAQNGVYNNDVYLYNADTTFINTYNTIDTFLIWEAANNDFVKSNLPSIFNAANTIREKAPSVINDYGAARSYYLTIRGETNATPAQLTQAQTQIGSAITELGDLSTNVNVVIPPQSTNSISTVLGK